MSSLVSLISLLLVFATLAVGRGNELTPSEKEDIIEAIGRRLERKAYAFETDFSTWPKIAESHSAAFESANSAKEFAAALDVALDEYDLSHLGILSPETVSLRRKGQRTGMGITIHPLDEGGGFISYVLAGSPAEKCGLRKGDIVTSIDGEPLVAIDQLAGELGQRRQLIWERDGAELSCEIEYAPFSTSERSERYWLREDVAVIQIQSFQYRYYNACKVNRFFREARHAKAIIIDLRNNRGGLSFYSRHLASKIAPARDTFARLARKKYEERQRSWKPVRPLPFSRPYKGKVVVLTDALSASAADLVPAFVSESGRGTVIGQRTSGALQLARMFPLPHGFRIYLPIAELLTPNGNRLEHAGFKPDIELSLRETVDDAAIFEKALQVIDRD